MQERERVQQPIHRGESVDPEDDRMAEVRAHADRLVGRSGRALDRLISANSEAFLHANLQTVGQ